MDDGIGRHVCGGAARQSLFSVHDVDSPKRYRLKVVSLLICGLLSFLRQPADFTELALQHGLKP
jgi:hypothetical protein